MQTFLPCEDFAATAAVLDDRRLGKQRVEALQVLRALTRSGYGWQHHPAVLMWAGYERALATYGLVVCDEWVRRGHPTPAPPPSGPTSLPPAFRPPPSQAELAAEGSLPPWLGDTRLHESHRAALLRKDPTFRFAGVPMDLPYHWPVRIPLKRPPGGSAAARTE